MFVKAANGGVWQVDGNGKEKIRLKDRNGEINAFPHPAKPLEVEVVYEVTTEQAVQLVGQQLDGTEI